MSMRSYQRQEGESARAFAAFELYRDMGPERSLSKVATLYYGEGTGNLRQIEEWSSKHDWVERVRAFDDWHLMLERSAIERYLQGRAQSHARREGDLREKSLEIREKALAQSEKMLDWPLVERRVVETDENGNEVTLVFFPARWSKHTAKVLFDMAMQHAPEDLEELAEPEEYDWSDWTPQEVRQLLELSKKISPKRPGEARSRGVP